MPLRRCLRGHRHLGGGASSTPTRGWGTLGYESQEMAGRDIKDFVVPQPDPRVAQSPRRRRGDVQEHRAIRKDGTWIAVETRGRDMPYHGRTVTVSAIRDITDWRRAEDRILLQVRRLAALRDIDAAINSSLDLKVTMGMFLEHVVARLGVDAADVLPAGGEGRRFGGVVVRGLPAHVLPGVHPLKKPGQAARSLERRVRAVFDTTEAGAGPG